MEKIKKVLLCIFILLICLSVVMCFAEDSGGDGKTTCRNCGRAKKLVPGVGYCSSCYDGFRDWQERTYN